MNKKLSIAITAAVIILIATVAVTVILLLPSAPETPPKLTYEEYNALSGEEQEAYFNSYPDIESFFEWYNTAKKEYEDKLTQIEIDGDVTVDLGDLIE